jgi:hypothetical protein
MKKLFAGLAMVFGVSNALASEPEFTSNARVYRARGGSVELRSATTNQGGMPVVDIQVTCDPGYNHIWIARVYQSLPADRHFCIPANADFTDMTCERKQVRGKRTFDCRVHYVLSGVGALRLDDFAVVSVMRKADSDLMKPLCLPLPSFFIVIPAPPAPYVQSIKALPITSRAVNSHEPPV